jgi:hypothetical protein
MPEKILPLLSAYMWDLRVECEAQLRALTLAQRLLEEYRDASGSGSREKVKRRLKADLNSIVDSNATIRAVVEEAVQHAARLPPHGE